MAALLALMRAAQAHHLGVDLIPRTVVPIVWQQQILPHSATQFGPGDINASLFLSPNKSTVDGVIRGAGGDLRMPKGFDNLLGAKKWDAGSAGVLLVVREACTAAMLADHTWSFTGDDARQAIGNTVVQPFAAAYTWPSAWTGSARSETVYSWKVDGWSVPVNFAVFKPVMFGRLPVSLLPGVGYWIQSPDAGPTGTRFRFQANFVRPT